ncbi:hypothetical protein QN096_11720 [Metapseudomonas otitidis]|uniref:hypothetical protein n=1 Tax=Metapseudomonas otitidis TaxID=319939 RepID=UPI00254102B5|nr:hypothetical protein [Pseudomonas otitidis]WIF69768.1 hypothetical protein QN096_11720 [Pseudomonas otitidis]
MRLGIVVGAVFALAGCAGRQDAEPRLVRVEVPVAVPCRVEEVAVPPWAASTLRAGDSLEMKVRALLAERRQRIGYERELLAANSGCNVGVRTLQH